MSSALVPLAIAAPAASAAPPVATLVQTIDMSVLSPPSPDPAGITYLPADEQLLVSDSEVEEMSIYDQVNLYALTVGGTLGPTGDTTSFSNEPTGLAFDPSSGHLFVSDDIQFEVFELDAGADQHFGTGDDVVVTSFGTKAFGDGDPEDIAFDTATGDLYLSDGVGAEVFRVSPGDNGVFDGVPPSGDDVTSHFDVGLFGAEDCEGLGYDPERDTLLVVDRNTNTIFEMSKDGFLVNAIDISAAGANDPADVVLAPGSSDPGRMNYYFVARGEDNDGNPLENDGKLYEMSVDLPPIGNLAPIADAGANQSVTLPAQATMAGSARDDGLPGALTTTWTKVSGPGTATFTDPSSPTTTVSFSSAGIYVLRLTADDGALQDADDVTVAVAEAGSTIVRRPVAVGKDDAEESSTGAMNLNSADLELVLDGSRGNQTVGMRFTGVTVPKNAVITNAYVQFTTARATSVSTALTVQAQAGDNPATFAKTTGNISSRPRTSQSVSWNPAPWTIVGEAGANQRTPNISNVIQAVVNRTGWASGNAMVIVITGSGKRAAEAFNGGAPPLLHIEYGGSPTNLAPSANAGPDQQVTLPNDATLAGSTGDDGVPNPPGAVTTTWSQVSGTQSVTLADPSSLTTTVQFYEAGTYVLRLTADDGALQTSDEVTITVDPVPGTNAAPTVNAGPDQQITLPGLATMAGSAGDDGLPSGTLTITWSQASGPGTATFTDPSSPTTTVSFSAAGSYALELTADDGALQTSDQLTVTVDPAPSNLVGNPGFETDTSGWNVAGSDAGVSLGRIAGGHAGSWAGVLTNAGAAGAMCKLNDQPNWVAVTGVGTYRSSMWVRADAPGATVTLRVREYVGGTLVDKGTVSVALSTAWQQVSLDYLVQSPGASTLDLQAWVPNAPVGTCFAVDDVQIAPL
ncbi:MAG TPA: hypothetical protein VFR44_14615 [Actinomycetota bacterium]|nr:hypothetical protein [Actinomycetota bacterium]